MSIGAVPLSEITGYWHNVEQICGELEDWIDLVQAMDCAFIEHHREKT